MPDATIESVANEIRHISDVLEVSFISSEVRAQAKQVLATVGGLTEEQRRFLSPHVLYAIDHWLFQLAYRTPQHGDPCPSMARILRSVARQITAMLTPSIDPKPKPKSDEQQRWLYVPDMMARFNVSRPTLYRMIKRGEVP
ncbi:MAG: helix-turn-helix transcriptional regulator, partial [Planctomycetota bacterium]